ncbi:MAG: signal peptidase I [Deltaproteobacteria bacterium]|nr:signal peptidase I [Candidatus Zymogenaceae bacterium]
MKKHVPFIVLVSVLALISLIYPVFFTTVKMEPPSMEPAIDAGDYLLVRRGAYGLRLPFVGEVVSCGRPARGDIVLIEKKRDNGQGTGADIFTVLRVVGLCGEVVSITDKRVWIDGEPLSEGYVTFSDDRVYPDGLSARDNMAAVVVPDDAFFVMGDRRDITTDSRFFGTVTRDEIIGKVMLVWW